ncbi:hypothetical protein [Fastidiosipila sanguinis]|uniref:Uncharacterized protein n=1 Tax=Fastidiosipila sanguinis TaxID=236753 RepID=A0A2S0KMG1_9FIRM|nr:hypothetical protein [Fastidiosipila sanguinis]AVM42198.1 hypothetical protein C5Q98_02655 [Fastidiosipila sanguinis]
MKNQKSFLEEFKSMLFDYKVIYIFIAYIIISLLSSFIIGYKPIKSYYRINDVEYADSVEELKEQYYGMNYQDILKDINNKIVEIKGYEDNDLLEALQKYITLSTELQGLLMSNTQDEQKLNELRTQVEESRKEYFAILNKINEDLPAEKQKEINTLDALTHAVSNQIEDSRSDTCYDLRKEGLLLGIGGYFGKNIHFIAWFNALLLELFLGAIAYFYVRKRKTNSSNNEEQNSHDESKKYILLSFISISLLMAIFMFIKHFIIVNLSLPGEIKNVYLEPLVNSSGNFTIMNQLTLTLVLSILYYIARPVIYAKRVEVISFQKSLIYFIIFNLIMYLFYFNVNNVGFVALTGPATLSTFDKGSITLTLLITITISSYISYISGKRFIDRRKNSKASQN